MNSRKRTIDAGVRTKKKEEKPVEKPQETEISNWDSLLRDGIVKEDGSHNN